MPASAAPHPLTRAERSGYTETSRHADVMAFIAELQALDDPRLHLSDFGATPEGRALPLLVLSAHGHFTPETAHASGLPVVLVVCGIFSGQLGPDSGVGTRNTAAGINLNRDFMRQDAPEMRLMQTRVCQPWNAHLVIDCHATNGSIHRFDLGYDIPHGVESGRREPID